MGRAWGNALNQRRKQAESGLKRTIREFLQWNHWYVAMVQGGPFGTPGISDLIAVRGGRTLFLEVKTPTGTLSAAQIEFGGEVKTQGGEYYVVRSIEDVEKIIKDG
jgi:hypothetical protein